MKILQDDTYGHFPLLVSVVQAIEYPGLFALVGAVYLTPHGKTIWVRGSKDWMMQEGPEPGPVVGPTATFIREVICTVTGKKIALNSPMDFCDWHTEESIVEQCWRHIIEMEIHEAGENFKFKGEKVRDPHAPKRGFF